MTDISGMFLLVVCFHVEFLQNVTDFYDGFIDFWILDLEVFHWDQFMCVGAEESGNQFAVFLTHWDLCFVAVSPWIFHSDCRFDFDFRHFGDAFHHLFDVVLFESQLGRVTQILQRHRTNACSFNIACRDTVRRTAQSFLNAGESERFADFRHFDVGPFAR
ncbi:hypothetical protein SDC9_151519 [bioreactor metagenome]|uniref:Uncharacterized protein n=1 Tax=bioreactor metagenome TaxID=1076179 RepID=A0A645EUV6_9ZZZZ